MDHRTGSAGALLDRFFGGTLNEKYISKNNPGFESYFVRIGDDIAIELMTKPALRALRPDNQTTGWVHLAIAVGSAKKVDALAKKHGRWGSWFHHRARPGTVIMKRSSKTRTGISSNLLNEQKITHCLSKEPQINMS